MKSPRTHREGLLRAVRIGPQDIEENRAGRHAVVLIRGIRRSLRAGVVECLAGVFP